MYISYPQRVVCLTGESVETFYLLGAQDKIVGISGAVKRPAEAVTQKPIVGDMLSVDMGKLDSLKPDLIITSSSQQPEVTEQLVRAGFQVLSFSTNSLSDIMQSVLIMASCIGKQTEGEALAKVLAKRYYLAAEAGAKYKFKPKVYFEEWMYPLVTPGGYISELIEAAGGRDIFIDVREKRTSEERTVLPAAIIQKNPDIIFASWNGQVYKKEIITRREGWESISAVAKDRVYEIDSSIILQPGPSAITVGLERMASIIAQAAR